MSGRRQLMMQRQVDKKLVIEMGLDNSVTFTLVNGALVASDGPWGWDLGDVGNHYGIEYEYPDLYFGRHACYANGQVWEMEEPLPLGWMPSRIKEVQLLECGRDEVSVGTEDGMCWITWTDTSVTVTDDDCSSSRYLIKIIFE